MKPSAAASLPATPYSTAASAYVSIPLSSSSTSSHSPSSIFPDAASTSSSSSAEVLENTEEPVAQPGVARWLFAVSGLVFAMVAIGGLTRLTKSGLSITEWKPAAGSLPPLSSAAWEAEFAKYRQYPEYRERVARGGDMSMGEFRFIYGMEFAHRQLGRIVGLVFVSGLAWYGVRGRLSRRLLGRLSLLAVAGGTQGAVGWWMVKSGLEQPHATPGGVHVSPYRLTLHLLSAFAIYAVLLSTALQLRWPHSVSAVQRYHSSPALRRVRGAAALTTALAALTIASGALVAGNEAGLVYNQFPLMGTGLIPSDLLSPYIQPAWRNAFEHSTLVQFQHRVLAVSTLAAVSAVWLFALRAPAMTRPMALARDAVMVMAWSQVGLGISTLLLYVPVPLASLHQCGSLALLTLLLTFVHTLGGPRVTALTRRVAPQLNAAARRTVQKQ